MVWPQMITPAIESIRDARFLSDQDKRNILGDNARRLLKIATFERSMNRDPYNPGSGQLVDDRQLGS
jgi:hypothetical protein